MIASSLVSSWTVACGAVLAILCLLWWSIHLLERITQRRLAQFFGWRAVLITGWLGTPIHELSHLVACWVFGHRVEAVALFSPDPQSGRLGYVHHSYRAGHYWQELGTVFIATAPLAGGAAALIGLLGLFFPSVLATAWTRIPWTGLDTAGAAMIEVAQAMSHTGQELFLAGHWASPRLWVFLYLVLCVGCHWAPSGSDYRNAGRGAVILLVAAAAAALTLSLFPTAWQLATVGLIRIATVISSLAALTVGLMSMAALMVWAATQLWQTPKSAAQ